MVRANIAAGHTVPSQGQAPGSGGHANNGPQVNTGATQQASAVHPSHPNSRGAQQGQHQPTEIALEEVRTVPRHVLAQEEEEEEMYEEEEEEEGDDQEDELEEEEESEDSSTDAYTRALPHLHTPAHPKTLTKIAPPRLNPRKRSSDDLEGDAVPGGASNGDAATGNAGRETRAGTPPKRAKMGPSETEERSTRDGVGKDSHTSVPGTPTRGGATTETEVSKATLDATTPTRQRKRSSEELDVNGGASPRLNGEDKQQKRLRVEPSVSVSPTKNRGAHPRATSKGLRSPRARSASASTPATGSVSPPSSVTVTSVDVDVNVDGGMLKAGLVNGGELDGLYVFEET